MNFKINDKVLLIAFILGFSIINHAHSLQFDPYFGTGGYRIYNLNIRDVPYDVIIDNNDNSFITGPTYLPRVNATGLQTNFMLLKINNIYGNPANYFGVNGFVTTDVSGINGTDVPITLGFQRKDVIVAGTSSRVYNNVTKLVFSMVKYDPIFGKLVPYFGNNGITFVNVNPLGTNDEILGSYINDDVSYFVGFSVPIRPGPQGTALDCAVAKLTYNGFPDNNFAQNGKIIIDNNGADELCRSIFSNGEYKNEERLFVGGRTRFNGTLDQNPFLVKLTPFGYYDYSMNPNPNVGPGKATENLNGNFAVVKTIPYLFSNNNNNKNDNNNQKNNRNTKILMTGPWNGWDNKLSGNTGQLVVLYDEFGNRVKNWGYYGVAVVIPYFNGSVTPQSMIIDYCTDSLFIVGGVTQITNNGTILKPYISRVFLSSGEVDYSFGVNGLWVWQSFPQQAQFRGISIKDRYMMIVGETYTTVSTISDILVVKLLIDTNCSQNSKLNLVLA